MVARAAQLLLTFAPLAALYPVARILRSFGLGGGSGREAEDLARALGDAPISDSAVADWYLRMCLWCVESSGAAVIKLMQWASSRPDMFGERFCEVFGALQDSTTPHAWRHTEETLRQNYGEGWEERRGSGAERERPRRARRARGDRTGIDESDRDQFPSADVPGHVTAHGSYRLLGTTTRHTAN